MNMMCDDVGAKSVICLVVCRQAVVALDLATALLEQFPRARVLHRASWAELEPDCLGREPIVLAVVEAAAEEVAHSALERRILADGGQILLMGEAAESAAAPTRWPVLERPFSIDLLRRFLARPPG
ncbi:MAG: hypothetical protein HC844_02380 [Tabrizicola sp.]|nr:hypothetical protein [Tabrizicola sp.]